jgi:prepilin-type N-terminal cleavage/methylation domain-containing protein
MSEKCIYKKKLGFTLLEILVVVGIFVLLSTIGILSITRSKNKTYIDNAMGSISTGLSKVQSLTRAGRSVDRTPAGSNTEVPRSYGISINQWPGYLNGFKIFADFPLAGQDPDLIPHCLMGAVPPPPAGCDPAGLGKEDTIVEDVSFLNGVEINAINVKIGGILTPVSRADLVFLIPTGETVLYYKDPVSNLMVKLNEPPENIYVRVLLLKPGVGLSGNVIIEGGILGAKVRY